MYQTLGKKLQPSATTLKRRGLYGKYVKEKEI
jgi:hypothetical protein